MNTEMKPNNLTVDVIYSEVLKFILNIHCILIGMNIKTLIKKDNFMLNVIIV